MSRLPVLIAAFALGCLCTLATYELQREGGKKASLRNVPDQDFHEQEIPKQFATQQIAPELSTAETIPSFEEAASYWLRQYLITVIPELAGASDWERTSLLREWAYREIDRAEVDSLLETMDPAARLKIEAIANECIQKQPLETMDRETRLWMQTILDHAGGTNKPTTYPRDSQDSGKRRRWRWFGWLRRKR